MAFLQEVKVVNMSSKERLIWFLLGVMPFIGLLIALAEGWIVL